MCRCTSIWMIGHKTRMFEVAFRMLLRHSFHSRFKFETHESTRVLTHTCSHAHVFHEHGHLCSYAHTRFLAMEVCVKSDGKRGCGSRTRWRRRTMSCCWSRAVCFFMRLGGLRKIPQLWTMWLLWSGIQYQATLRVQDEKCKNNVRDVSQLESVWWCAVASGGERGQVRHGFHLWQESRQYGGKERQHAEQRALELKPSDAEMNSGGGKPTETQTNGDAWPWCVWRGWFVVFSLLRSAQHFFEFVLCSKRNTVSLCSLQGDRTHLSCTSYSDQALVFFSKLFLILHIVHWAERNVLWRRRCPVRWWSLRFWNYPQANARDCPWDQRARFQPTLSHSFALFCARILSKVVASLAASSSWIPVQQWPTPGSLHALRCTRLWRHLYCLLREPPPMYPALSSDRLSYDLFTFWGSKHGRDCMMQKHQRVKSNIWIRTKNGQHNSWSHFSCAKQIYKINKTPSPQKNRPNNNNTIWGGSVLTGEERPRPLWGVEACSAPKQAAQSNPSWPALCRQDSTSPWSTDNGRNS